MGPLVGVSVFSSENKLNHKPLMLSPHLHTQRSELLQICTRKKDDRKYKVYKFLLGFVFTFLFEKLLFISILSFLTIKLSFLFKKLKVFT